MIEKKNSTYLLRNLNHFLDAFGKANRSVWLFFASIINIYCRRCDEFRFHHKTVQALRYDGAKNTKSRNTPLNKSLAASYLSSLGIWLESLRYTVQEHYTRIIHDDCWRIIIYNMEIQSGTKQYFDRVGRDWWPHKWELIVFLEPPVKLILTVDTTTNALSKCLIYPLRRTELVWSWKTSLWRIFKNCFGLNFLGLPLDHRIIIIMYSSTLWNISIPWVASIVYGLVLL